VKTKKRGVVSIILFIFIFLIITSGCSKGGNSKEAILNGEIYPIGIIKAAKIFDASNNAKTVILNQTDVEYILQIVKNADKELVNSYDNAMELNISLTDSTIQLVRKDSEIIYYVFHNGKIDGITYKIHSNELSEWILKLGKK
jgi:hypothetical protein